MNATELSRTVHMKYIFTISREWECVVCRCNDRRSRMIGVDATPYLFTIEAANGHTTGKKSLAIRGVCPLCGAESYLEYKESMTTGIPAWSECKKVFENRPSWLVPNSGEITAGIQQHRTAPVDDGMRKLIKRFDLLTRTPEKTDPFADCEENTPLEAYLGVHKDYDPYSASLLDNE